jgi:transcriptional regulator with XRE-family HTH domain
VKGDLTLDQFIAEQLQDPGFAAAWAIQRPLGYLGLNVWSLREASGMTQQQLAEAAKMKQPRIAEIERGDGNPTLLTISRIALALGVTADRLLAEPDDALMAKARAIVDTEVATWSPRRRRALGLLDDDAETQPAPAAPKRRRKTA